MAASHMGSSTPEVQRNGFEKKGYLPESKTSSLYFDVLQLQQNVMWFTLLVLKLFSTPI